LSHSLPLFGVSVLQVNRSPHLIYRHLKTFS
jgi:hypothetical protein